MLSMCVLFAVKRGFGSSVYGSLHHLSINEACYLLAAGISWSVLHCFVFLHFYEWYFKCSQLSVLLHVID